MQIKFLSHQILILPRFVGEEDVEKKVDLDFLFVTDDTGKDDDAELKYSVLHKKKCLI